VTLAPLRYLTGTPLVHGELLVQGEVLEGEVPVAAAEEWQEAKHVEQHADHGGRLFPNQS
jgi:hypothetical protein